MTPTFVDIPQKIELGSRYPLTSFQLRGWSVLAMHDNNGMTGIVFRVFNETGMAVVDL